HSLAGLQEHAGTRPRPFLEHRFAYQELLFWLQAPVSEHFESEIGSHHFGDRCGKEAPVRLALMQHLAGMRVEKHGDWSFLCLRKSWACFSRHRIGGGSCAKKE